MIGLKNVKPSVIQVTNNSSSGKLARIKSIPSTIKTNQNNNAIMVRSKAIANNNN